MPKQTPRAVFSAMSERNARALLRRNHVGRLCFLNEGQPDVAPVHYVTGNDWIFIRIQHVTSSTVSTSTR